MTIEKFMETTKGKNPNCEIAISNKEKNIRKKGKKCLVFRFSIVKCMFAKKFTLILSLEFNKGVKS